MSRGNDNGWDFVEVGKQYQYKEDGLIALVTVLSDNSTETNYSFEVQIDMANMEVYDPTFALIAKKSVKGYYSGMPQLYETSEYLVDYTWKRKVKDRSELEMRDVPLTELSNFELVQIKSPEKLEIEGMEELPWVTKYYLNKAKKNRKVVKSLIKSLIKFIQEEVHVSASLWKGGGLRVTVVILGVRVFDRVIKVGGR